MDNKYDDESKDAAVRLYQQGVKTDKILKETGLSRAMLYYVLQTRGIKPTRKVGRSSELTTSEVLEQLSAAHREIGRLEAECERLMKELSTCQEKARAARRRSG
jgi:hypothetical protein